jgi:hypothetical protein
MRRIVIAVCCLSLLWTGYVAYANYMTLDMVRFFEKENPIVNVLPTPSPDVSLGTLSGPRVDRFGLSFQVPGEAVEGGRELQTVSFTRFANGGGLIFSLAPVDTAKMWRDETNEGKNSMAGVLGPQTLRSNYDLMAAAVQATPASAKWYAGRTENARTMLLLSIKAMSTGRGNAIHPRAGGDVRGFQFGDPSVAPYLVSLELFDRQDKQYLIVLNGKSGSKPIISQSQINALIASTKTAP